MLQLGLCTDAGLGQATCSHLTPALVPTPTPVSSCPCRLPKNPHTGKSLAWAVQEGRVLLGYHGRPPWVSFVPRAQCGGRPGHAHPGSSLLLWLLLLGVAARTELETTPAGNPWSFQTLSRPCCPFSNPFSLPTLALLGDAKGDTPGLSLECGPKAVDKAGSPGLAEGPAGRQACS